MPIYTYYCARCHGQFDHLAREFAAPAPRCPRCGDEAVTRLISSAHLVHGARDHQQRLRAAAGHVADDPQAAARFLKASGRLEDADGLYGSRAYRELIERRSEGASDADLGDLVDDLALEARPSEATQMSGALMFSDRVENRMSAQGPPDREHEEPGENAERDARAQARSRRTAAHLGWG